jgi:hypothetical protein
MFLQEITHLMDKFTLSLEDSSKRIKKLRSCANAR